MRTDRRNFPEKLRAITKAELNNVPNNWVMCNSLFEINMSDAIGYIEQGYEDLSLFFVKNCIYIATPKEKQSISVDWLPETDSKGSFLCRIIKNKNWDKPVETKQFKTWQEVRDWVNVWINRLVEMEN